MGAAPSGPHVNLITSQRPPLLTPSQLQHMNLEKTQTLSQYTIEIRSPISNHIT